MSLPGLVQIEEVRARLNSIFPAEFPDRGVLVGVMAARTVFVALYGGFVQGYGGHFRPSTVTRFTDDQAALTSSEDRQAWASACHKGKFKAPGTAWYAADSREGIRDDLLRNRLIPLGVAHKLEGNAPTASTPIYSLSADFANLFDPALTGQALGVAVEAWRHKHLNAMTLKRMALLTSGVKDRKGQVVVTLPTTAQTLRLAPGQASVITRDVCEVLGPAMLTQPVVVHLSLSDQKTFPELATSAKMLGLDFDVKAELPDVVIAEISEKLVLMFVEVVH